METTGACSGNYGPAFPYYGRAAAILSQHSSPTSVLTHTHQPEVQDVLWEGAGVSQWLAWAQQSWSGVTLGKVVTLFTPVVWGLVRAVPSALWQSKVQK